MLSEDHSSPIFRHNMVFFGEILKSFRVENGQTWFIWPPKPLVTYAFLNRGAAFCPNMRQVPAKPSAMHKNNAMAAAEKAALG